MTTHALAHRPSRTGGIHTRADVLTSAGTHIPAADVHARQIAREAERWLALATERTRMKPGTLAAKALGACAFSVHKRASSLAVPSKLTGTSRHQPRLRALVNDPKARWAALDLDAVEDGLLVRHDGAPLGLVQSKHLGWVRPLVPFGLTVYLSRVTGGGGAVATGSGATSPSATSGSPFADWRTLPTARAEMALRRYRLWTAGVCSVSSSPARLGPSAFPSGPSTRR